MTLDEKIKIFISLSLLSTRAKNLLDDLRMGLIMKKPEMHLRITKKQISLCIRGQSDQCIFLHHLDKFLSRVYAYEIARLLLSLCSLCRMF